MAYQTGTIKVQGMLSDLVFYKTKHGDLVRRKTSVNKHRIHNDPAFLRTRENNNEFGNASSAAKLLLKTLRPFILEAGDNMMISRLTRIMIAIKNFDVLNARGQRTITEGLKDADARKLLNQFSFNPQTPLNRILFIPPIVDQASGSISIPDLIPSQALSYPSAATHVIMQAAFAIIDFSNRKGELQTSASLVLPIDATETDVTLTPEKVPSVEEICIHLLKIGFLQAVNGELYTLSEGNAVGIILVP